MAQGLTLTLESSASKTTSDGAGEDKEPEVVDLTSIAKSDNEEDNIEPVNNRRKEATRDIEHFYEDPIRVAGVKKCRRQCRICQ